MIPFESHPMTPLHKALAALAALGLFGIGIMFSIVIIPIMVLMGAAGLGYFYWKTRALRKVMAQAASEHQVIEGEAVVIHEHEENAGRLPEHQGGPREAADR